MATIFAPDQGKFKTIARFKTTYSYIQVQQSIVPLRLESMARANGGTNVLRLQSFIEEENMVSLKSCRSLPQQCGPWRKLSLWWKQIKRKVSTTYRKSFVELGFSVTWKLLEFQRLVLPRNRRCTIIIASRYIKQFTTKNISLTIALAQANLSQTSLSSLIPTPPKITGSIPLQHLALFCPTY